MKIIPMYLYGTNSVPQVGDGSLFHYTKFESFLKILETMTLRSSPLCKMNDLNEADLSGIDWSRHFLFINDAQNYIRTQCSVISFTQNYEIGSVCREGANHPAMWAHYADNSEGVCIVLHKDAIIENNSDRLKEVFYKLEKVDYTCNHAPEIDIIPEDYSNASDIVRKHYKELFFKKDVDWEKEDEVRFLVESPEFYLNIKDSIMYIVLGKRLIENKENMSKLLSLIASPTSKCYKYFSPNSFVTISKSQGGYSVYTASHYILQCAHEFNNTFHNILDSLGE